MTVLGTSFAALTTGAAARGRSFGNFATGTALATATAGGQAVIAITVELLNTIGNNINDPFNNTAAYT